MVSYRYIILLLGIVLSACATVGTVSGGPQDTSAPKPIDKKTFPPNGSTNFSGNSVEMTFDEFFRLDQPNLNIRMVPAHATVFAKVKGKRLFLNWQDSLKPNTTYAIYLNNVVRDITERNDTIIQYAFSTGDVLDTLSYEIPVVDAWSGNPISKCVVGLFDAETQELLNFSETNDQGWAKLSYLQSRQYQVFAFNDANGDLEIQDHERIGFTSEPTLSLDSSIVDSIPIRLFSPIQEPKVTTTKYFAPGSIVIGANTPLTDVNIRVNDEVIDTNHYSFITEDSLLVYVELGDTNVANIILNSTEITDTNEVRFFNKKMPPIGLKLSKMGAPYSPFENVSFTTNDFITSLDSSKIHIQRKEDSTQIPFSVSFEFDEIIFDIDSTGNFVFHFEKGAVTTTHGASVEKKQNVTRHPINKFGNLSVDLSYYINIDCVLRLIKGRNVIEEVVIPAGTESHLFEGLSPGEYTFDLVRDENKNGHWDVGSLDSYQQAELVDHFSKAIKVRANWDIDVALIPNETE